LLNINFLIQLLTIGENNQQLTLILLLSLNIVIICFNFEVEFELSVISILEGNDIIYTFNCTLIE